MPRTICCSVLTAVGLDSSLLSKSDLLIAVPFTVAIAPPLEHAVSEAASSRVARPAMTRSALRMVTPGWDSVLTGRPSRRLRQGRQVPRLRLHGLQQLAQK